MLGKILARAGAMRLAAELLRILNVAHRRDARSVSLEGGADSGVGEILQAAKGRVMRGKVFAFAVLTTAVMVSGAACSSDAHTPLSDGAEASVDSAQASPKPPASDSPGAADLPVEVNAADYCGVLHALEDRLAVIASMSTEEQVLAAGRNLDYLADGAGLLADFDSERRETWELASSSQRAAGEFFAVSGGQVANDDFLYLLAVAVADSDAAYAATREHAAELCALDVSVLMTPER